MWLGVLVVTCAFASVMSDGSTVSAIGPAVEDFSREQTPQFVMLTFDDGVNLVNHQMYKKLFLGQKLNKANQCNIRGTFYVTHDYTNYQFVHQLYRFGNEIAVHSISHLSSTDYWKTSTYDVWREELVGMRTIISNLANIPEDQIVGSRAPFLQTSGDSYFRVLKDAGFLYDSSMPSRAYTDNPIWPYNLDNSFRHDCQIEPCPEEAHPGLWLTPMINWVNGGFHCAMVDACTPAPNTTEETLKYFKSNFERHYQTSKAPFPFFLHQAWLQNPAREAAYFQFIDWLLEKDDVFLTSVKEVVEYVKNPVPLDEYKTRTCGGYPLPANCRKTKVCHYKNVPPVGERYMTQCKEECSRSYPWVGNPKGF